MGQHRDGVGNQVKSLVVMDDGTGAALYVGGWFTEAGGFDADRVVRWDGKTWSPLGAIGHHVELLFTADDGSGLALHAAGDFAPGFPTEAVARWNGQHWSLLGGAFTGNVHAGTTFDDGQGPALYVAGSFGMAGGVAVTGVARWTGSAWAPLGAGLDGSATSLAVFDDGSGPALYAGGSFNTAGGVPASGVARWDGTSWASLPAEPSLVPDHIASLTVHDDGSGPALYAAGTFGDAQPATKRVARWDGSDWTAIGAPYAGTIAGFASLGDRLVVHGGFVFLDGQDSVENLASWDGIAWTELGETTAVPTIPGSVAVFDHGNGPQVYVGGSFDAVHGVNARFLARFEGEEWRSVGYGVDAPVRAVATFDDGGGEAVFVGGDFTQGDMQRIGRFADGAWRALGTGLDGRVDALVVHDDGSGSSLFVGGEFTEADGAACARIARWDGTAFHPVGSGFDGPVRALAAHEGGGGLLAGLYAGGEFSLAGGSPAANVARWDGKTWQPLGGGTLGAVLALALFEHAPGSLRLVAGGTFTGASGAPAAQYVAQWDGSGWARLLTGVNAPVRDLLAAEDGGQPVLYVAGDFSTAGLQPAYFVARWDNTGWHDVGTSDGSGFGFWSVSTLALFDDATGGGPLLYAGGTSPFLGGDAVPFVGRWDGSEWKPVWSESLFAPLVLEAVPLDGVPALLVGGTFEVAPDPATPYLSPWIGCGEPTWSDLGGGTPGSAGTPTLTMEGTLEPGSTLALHLVEAHPSALGLLFLSVTSTPTPFLGGTLAAFPWSLLQLVATDPAGELHASVPFPSAPSGLELFLQVAVSDPPVPVFGAALSNGVLGTVP